MTSFATRVEGTSPQSSTSSATAVALSPLERARFVAPSFSSNEAQVNLSSMKQAEPATLLDSCVTTLNPSGDSCVPFGVTALRIAAASEGSNRRPYSRRAARTGLARRCRSSRGRRTPSPRIAAESEGLE